MEIEKKKKVNHTTAVFTHTKWSRKTEAITQMISIKTSSQLKYPEKWRYNMRDSYFLAWIIHMIASSLHYSYLHIA